jgi:hypothetical protein
LGLGCAGKKHRQNRDGMRTETWVERGLGKENGRNRQKKSTAEIGKQTGIRIERGGLEYGLNIDQKRNVWKEETEKKSTAKFLPLYYSLRFILSGAS